MRLAATYRFLLTSGGDTFTTTLTMGSNKSAVLISSIGDGIAGDTFLKYDFKKKDGFKRAGELARQFGLYRQHYCGCIYSQQEAEKRHRLGPSEAR
jgi:predicted adenine nucleotide alpha hydrolase (AANH) superfamily ATPase